MSRRTIAEPTAKFVCTTRTRSWVSASVGSSPTAIAGTSPVPAGRPHEQRATSPLLLRAGRLRNGRAGAEAVRKKPAFASSQLVQERLPRRMTRLEKQASRRVRNMRIRVVVVDDFPLVREGLTASLQVDPAIEVRSEERRVGKECR